jgi:TRAP-type C4-dicarboxylate transport system substrate-binding protein
MNLIRSCAIAATLLAGTVSARAEQVDILLNNFVPPSFFMYTVLPEWGQKVEEATEGRVRVTIPAGSLAPPPEQWNAVENGIFDAAWIFNSFIGNRVSLSLLAQLPFIAGKDSHATGVALWNTHQKFFADSNEYEGLHLLSLFAFSGADLYSLNDEPIDSVEDLASRRMWTLPGSATDAAKALGAAIVSSPATQVHDYVSKNVVEGFYGIGLSTADQYKVLPYAKSVTEFPREVFTATFSLFVRDDVWAKISAEDQAAIMALSGAQLSAEIGDIVNGLDDAAREKAKAEGVTFFDADPAFYQALRETLSDREAAWAAKAGELGVDGRAAIEYFKSEVARLEAN